MLQKIEPNVKKNIPYCFFCYMKKKKNVQPNKLKIEVQETLIYNIIVKFGKRVYILNINFEWIIVQESLSRGVENPHNISTLSKTTLIILAILPFSS